MNNEHYENAKQMFELAKRIARKLYKENFLGRKPNNNTTFEETLAIQIISATNLLLAIKENTDKDNTLVAGILTRSLIEVTANINYFVVNKSNEKMQTAFLETARTVTEKIYEVKNKKKGVSEPTKWADISLTKRVTLLNSKEASFLALWIYLSSFAHSDAGYLGSHVSGIRERLPAIFLSFSCLLFFELASFLDKGGVIKGGYGKLLLDSAKEYVKDSEVGG